MRTLLKILHCRRGQSFHSDSCATRPKNAPSTYSQVPQPFEIICEESTEICRWPGEEIVLEEIDRTGERRMLRRAPIASKKFSLRSCALFHFCSWRLRLESQFRQFTLGKHPGLTVNCRRNHPHDTSHCTKYDAMKEFRRAGFHTGTDQELYTLGGYEIVVSSVVCVGCATLSKVAKRRVPPQELLLVMLITVTVQYRSSCSLYIGTSSPHPLCLVLCLSPHASF